MASSATVGALKIVLSADSAQFAQGVKEAENIAARFGNVIGKAAGVVAAFGAAAAAAAAVVAVNMRKVATEADEMGKAAQKVGLMATELSALKYTADLAGVGFESLQTSLVRLTRSMSEVAKGGESDAAKAFQVLGISVTNADGSLRSASDVMGDVAQKFSEFKDGAEKTALAVAIFGRAGADMIPLLNQGRDAIAASNEEAKQFGVTMSDQLTRSSEQLNDNLSRVGSAMHGIYVQISERVVPKLAELSDQFVALIKELKLAESAGHLAEKALGGLAYYAALAKGNFEGLTTSVVGWRDAVSTAFSGDLGGALTKLATLRETLADIEKKMISSMQRISLANAGLLAGASPILSADGFSGGKPGEKPPAPTLGSASSGVGGASTPQSEYDAEKARIEGKLQAIREGILSEQELRAEKYEADRNLVEEAYNAEIISAEQHNEYMLGLERKFQEEKEKIRTAANNKALTDTASFLGSAVKITESWGKKNNAIAKALGIAQALISTYVGATKAMEAFSTGGPVAGLAAFAAVLAKGLSAVAAITAVNPNGQSGGGRSVGGGSAAPVAATPEREQSRSMYVTLNGSTFNREQMREFFEHANSFYKDGGGQIIFAR